ncbi:hypothetical protein DFP72DRAFT_1066904 [Ephemerocybe angulata]|uniref:Uncharacterized protein n=1 Tax=Ephemerocybe angulata TaxID=980116 RepID=A0A8H6M8J9_9AGAR|nr:hypothetical protein DFP72DRAFT_1066904 [Tulosesus angulatus]
MPHPPASAPEAPSKKRKRTPTTSTIPKPTTTTRTGAPTAAHFARITAISAQGVGDKPKNASIPAHPHTSEYYGTIAHTKPLQ